MKQHLDQTQAKLRQQQTKLEQEKDEELIELKLSLQKKVRRSILNFYEMKQSSFLRSVKFLVIISTDFCW